MGFSLLTAWRDYHQHDWGNFAFAVFNAVLAAGAIRAHIGLGAATVDMALGAVNWLYVDKPSKKTADPVVPSVKMDVDWSTIPYYGDRRLARDLRVRGDRRRRLQHRRR